MLPSLDQMRPSFDHSSSDLVDANRGFVKGRRSFDTFPANLVRTSLSLIMVGVRHSHDKSC
jgi:hypothetical protein